VVDFARFYGIRGAADPKVGNDRRMAMYMMENKNNKKELCLIKDYRIIYYCLLSRSILGGFVIQHLSEVP